MLKEGRKPGLPKLTRQNMDDAPEETRWVESIKLTVNNAIEQIEHIRSEDAGIQLLKNADVEMADVEVQVPDPWIEVDSFDNGWSESGDNNKYCKGPDGVVEVRFDLIGGGAGLSAFTLPIGYRPSTEIRMSVWDGIQADNGVIDTAGNVIPLGVHANDEPKGQVRFLAKESNPIPLSCWPKFIKTKFSKVSSVVVVNVIDGEASGKLPAGAVHPPVWEMTTEGGVNQVKLLNIAGLPYNRKSLVRLLIIGG